MSYKTIWKCMFSPRLTKISQRGTSQSEPYNMNGLEKYGDNVVYTINMVCNIGLYASPIILLYLYRRNYFMMDGLFMLFKFSTSMGILYLMSLYLRGWGRANQPVYMRFLETLQTSHTNLTPEVKAQLQTFEFDFYAWPVEYKADSNRRNLTRNVSNECQFGRRGLLAIPFQIVAYFAVQTFGLRLIYPGSMAIVQALLGANLVQGRTRMIQVFNGQRFKLQTEEGNFIDSMFIDNRMKTPNGNILFVCSEGNAGFYEIGIMCSPIEAGYSVLGWNHPGFGGSTGRPFPTQEQNAVDVVMQLAINKLGFAPENIILFGWSIGGYATTWAASNYPNVKAVILDASFDDILPLAVEHMPKVIGPIVKLAVRDYVNLNNIHYLKKFSGPVLLVRRSEDEVICTEEQNIATNRGNFLLSKMLTYRYPLIYNETEQQIVLNEFLSSTGLQQEVLVRNLGGNDDICSTLLQSYVSEHSKSFPMQIGQDMDNATKKKMALFLAKKHFKDYKSTHCTPLPVEFLREVWDIPTSS